MDDSEENRILVRMFLKKYDFEIIDAENGKVALDYVNKSPFHMIFMDLQMPVLDGFSAISEIRKLELTLKRSPSIIIALTAHTTDEDRAKAFRAGCNEYLTKPLQKMKLIACIDSFCKEHPTPVRQYNVI